MNTTNTQKTKNTQNAKQTKTKKPRISMLGSTNALKKGNTKGSKVNNWLRSTGVLEEINQFEPKETGDFVKDVVNKGKWLKEKQEMLNTFLEIYASIGGTAANYTTLIKQLEYDLLMLKKKLEEQNINPLENANYHKNLKLLQEMILSANKLNLDIGKASAEFELKKNKQSTSDDLFVMQEETN